MKTTLNVEGMSCTSCIEHVETALRDAGAAEVHVDLDHGRVTVEHEPTISAGRLVAALEQAGYGAAPRAGCCCG